MQKINKLFGNINMSWLRVIIFALISAVYTALINQVPLLKNTSFTDIAVGFECWVLFAIIIIVNCRKWWEASLKTFVFFLISQPLIYLIEVPFSPLSWGLFGYYKHWFMWTVLTLPGAAIAFFVKKQNCLSAVILSVANLLLAYSSMYYLNSCIYNPPHHILSSVFCAAEAVFLIFVLLKPKKPRILALSLFGLSMIASVLYTFIL